MARVLIISDIHIDDEPEDRLSWLVSLIKRYKPVAVLSLGDFGSDFDYTTVESEILHRCKFYAIYGNHDNLAWLSSARNLDGESVLLEDGEIREWGGHRLGFINGIIALRKRSKRGVPRKKPWEFMATARKLAGRIDVLAMHEFPAPDELLDQSFDLHAPALTAREAVIQARPEIVICGHIHYRMIEPGLLHIGDIKLVVIDSSVGGYALLGSNSVELRIHEDVIFRLNLK